MGKIVLIAVIIGMGYAWQKGGLKEWFDATVDQQRASMQTGSGPPPAAQQDTPAPPSGPPPGFDRQAATSTAEACARARSNVREIESWMRSGGKVVETTGQKKTLSENETFSAISRERLFIEQNCGGR